MIEWKALSKRYGRTLAVDGLETTVEPGRVTGFLGPNGAGKSTAMRITLGLDLPDSGTALVNGRPYRRLRHPLHTVGAMLDADAAAGGLAAETHLRALAISNGIPRRRVAQVLGLAGLESAAGRRIRGLSLGMRQRLGIAGALLGDPEILLLDEPVNGLDPQGVRWIRDLMRELAAEGRTVLVSSHLMSEMALTADRLLVVGRGRLIAEADVGELASRCSKDVLVRTPQAELLAEALRARGATVRRLDDGDLSVEGVDAEEVGRAAASGRIELHRLTPREASLEEAYLRLTEEHVEFRAAVKETK